MYVLTCPDVAFDPVTGTCDSSAVVWVQDTPTFSLPPLTWEQTAMLASSIALMWAVPALLRLVRRHAN